MKTMTDDEIIALFDSTNMTLEELSQVSHRTVGQLKELLMGDGSDLYTPRRT